MSIIDPSARDDIINFEIAALKSRIRSWYKARMREAGSRAERSELHRRMKDAIVSAVAKFRQGIQQNDFCRVCGYCLCELTEARCPECGCPFTGESPISHW